MTVCNFKKLSVYRVLCLTKKETGTILASAVQHITVTMTIQSSYVVQTVYAAMYWSRTKLFIKKI